MLISHLRVTEFTISPGRPSNTRGGEARNLPVEVTETTSCTYTAGRNPQVTPRLPAPAKRYRAAPDGLPAHLIRLGKRRSVVAT